MQLCLCNELFFVTFLTKEIVTMTADHVGVFIVQAHFSDIMDNKPAQHSTDSFLYCLSIFCCRTRCLSTEEKTTSGLKNSLWGCSLSSQTPSGWPAQRPLETTSATPLDSVSSNHRKGSLLSADLLLSHCKKQKECSLQCLMDLPQNVMGSSSARVTPLKRV